MSLENLFAQLDGQLTGEEAKLPPVEMWDPEYCGEMDLIIKANGEWFYNGTPFKRLRLVKLLASVLKKENDDYFLVTPVEKIKINVEDAPFVLTQWQWQDESHQRMMVATHLGDEFILGKEHPVMLNEHDEPYVIVRRNLQAKVHRNVYYQWLEQATEQHTSDSTALVIKSDGVQFVIGRYQE
ncbi:DUF1285 domain-containing protein [Thalassotalea sp. M1531]|uniref:DUF1285 domain-containing protein n=2 Tax=Thalassotalea algicola TaxID=2716224 RepID=A0A7Y0Q513_9GAMM|nr:DUF1285 domain-containing protein [Thalassotalea algicola]